MIKRLLVKIGYLAVFVVGFYIFIYLLSLILIGSDQRTQNELQFYINTTQTLLDDRKYWIETVSRLCPELDKLAQELVKIKGNFEYNGCKDEWLEKAKNLPVSIDEFL